MQPDGCMNTNGIEKRVVLRATQGRVWRAVSDATEFGSWFGMRLDGVFAAGAKTRGVIAPTSVDSEVAAMQKPYEGRPIEMTIERMEPERFFSFRWHPYGIEEGVDYSAEPMTLVVFELEPLAEGVMLTVTESGFDQIPVERRGAGRLRRMTEGGASRWG